MDTDRIKAALEAAFKAGQSWAECYVSWFIPTEYQHKENMADAVRNGLSLLSAPSPVGQDAREVDIAESCYEAAHAMPQYDAIQFIAKLIADPDPSPNYPLTEAWLERDKAKADFSQLQLCLDAECELRRTWQIRAEKAESALDAAMAGERERCLKAIESMDNPLDPEQERDAIRAIKEAKR